MSKIELWLWFDNIKGIGKKSKYNLYTYFKSIEALYDAGYDEYKKSGVRITSVSMEALCCKQYDFDEILEKFDKLNIKPVSIDMEEYPNLLKQTQDAPVVIYCRGKFININDKMCVSVVGSRKLSVYGKNNSYNISKKLAQRGVIIVSGLAYGIDTMAHLGALDADMPTIAVLGCGPDVVYPASNKTLMDRIMKTGMIISEYPLGTEAQSYTFPERNKIIAGISVATVVIEANIKSGSLITAELAEKYERKVFALPGNIDSDYSKGTNLLIKNGADILTCAEDIMEKFPQYDKKLQKTEFSEKKEIKYEKDSPEYRIISNLESQPVSIDELSEKSGIDVVTLNSKLLIMEIQGIITKHPGNRYSIEGRILN